MKEHDWRPADNAPKKDPDESPVKDSRDVFSEPDSTPIPEFDDDSIDDMRG